VRFVAFEQGQPGHGLHDREAGADGPFRIVLVRLGVAEEDQLAISQVAGHEATEPCDHLGNAAVIGPDHVAEILRIEPRCQSGRTDEIAEHDREQPTFCGRGRMFGPDVRICGKPPGPWFESGELGSAVAAELGIGGIGSAAGWAQ
jgi:hypothetical protein